MTTFTDTGVIEELMREGEGVPPPKPRKSTYYDKSYYEYLSQLKPPAEAPRQQYLPFLTGKAVPLSAHEQRMQTLQLGQEYGEWGKFILGEYEERPEVPMWDVAAQEMMQSQEGRWREIVTEAGTPEYGSAEWEEAADVFLDELGLSPQAVTWARYAPDVYSYLEQHIEGLHRGMDMEVSADEWPSELKTIEEVLEFGATHPTAFMRGIEEVGRSPETTLLLEQFGMDSKEIANVFGERVKWQFPSWMRDLTFNTANRWPGWMQTATGGHRGKGGVLAAMDWSYAHFILPWSTMIGASVADIRRSDEDKAFLKIIKEQQVRFGQNYIYTDETHDAYQEWEESIPGWSATLIDLSHPGWWVIPGAIGARAALLPIAARGGVRGAAAQAGRGAAYLPAGLERGVAGLFKGVVHPLKWTAQKAYRSSLNKIFESSLEKAVLEQFSREAVASTGITARRAVATFVRDNQQRLIAKAQENLTRLEDAALAAGEKDASAATRQAAKETAEAFALELRAAVEGALKIPVAAATEAELRTLVKEAGYKLVRIPITSKKAIEGFFYRIEGQGSKVYAKDLQEATNFIVAGDISGLSPRMKLDRLIDLSMKQLPTEKEIDEVIRLSIEIPSWQVDNAIWAEATRGNIPLGVVRHPAFVETPGQMMDDLTREFFTAAEGSYLDKTSTTFSKAIHIDEMDVDVAMERFGVEMAEDTFKVAEGFKQPGLIQDLVDIARGKLKVPLSWLTPTEAAQAMGKGMHENPISRYVVWATRRTDQAQRSYVNFSQLKNFKGVEELGLGSGRMKPQRQIAGHVGEHVSTEEAAAGAKGVDALLAKPEIMEHLGTQTVEMQRKIVQLAQFGRTRYDVWFKQQNATRAARGDKLIPYRQDYVQAVREHTIHARIFNHAKNHEQIMQQIPDSYPHKVFNPRAMAREGLIPDYWKEWDILTLMDDYVHTASRDIFFTNILKNTQVHAKALREMGFKTNADYLEAWVSEVYAGSKDIFRIGAENIFGDVAVKGMLGIRRMLNRSVFGINPQWNIFIQPSSMVLAQVRYGTRNTIRGAMDFLTNSSIRDDLHKGVYSAIVKAAKQGRISQQDLANVMERSLARGRTPVETLDHCVFYFTSAIEDRLTGASCLAAKYRGEQLGYSGRGLLEWTSDGGALTQSMYNRVDMPRVLRPVIGMVAPFQTFVLQLFNLTRTFNIPGYRILVGKAGAYQSVSATSAAGQAVASQRRKQLLEFFAGALAVNMAVETVSGRKPWVPSSFLPFFNVATGGMNVANPWGHPLPTQYMSDWKKGVDAIMEHGNWQKLRKWFVRYHTPGGTQVNRTVDALIAMAQGEVTNVAGKPMFEMDTDSWEEWTKAIFMGPYKTEAGRQFWAERNRDQGWFDEFKNLDYYKLPWLPSGEIDVAGELLSTEGLLGCVDEEGNRVGLSKYRSIVTRTENKVGEDKMQKDAPPLAEFFLDARAKWEAMRENNAPPDRVEYREKNPWLDAAMFFWGESATLRSDDARKLVADWLDRYDIPEWALSSAYNFERIRKQSMPTSREAQIITEFHKLPVGEQLTSRCNNQELDAALVRVEGQPRHYGTKKCQGIGPITKYK